MQHSLKNKFKNGVQNRIFPRIIRVAVEYFQE